MPRCILGHQWLSPANGATAVCPICGLSAKHGADAELEPTVRLRPKAPSARPRDGDQPVRAQPARSRPAAMPSIPGYDVVAEIGRGGMGVVYEAWQIGLKRRVALKMILADAVTDASAYDRFRQEAAVLAQLQHPNIVQIFDIGEHADRPYFSLEFVQGGSLSRHLAGNPQSPIDSAKLIAVLARAIQAAHDKGIVHRDLKPANVLLAQNDEGGMRNDETPASGSAVRPSTFIVHHFPKIADFGLAKLIEGEGARQMPAELAGLTRTGIVMGTPSYMAPEQASGKGTVGPAADIYALGAILYEMLTGRPPFLGPTPLETAVQVTTLEPVPPRRLQPHIPRDLEIVCLKCLRKELAGRYASARDLAEDLDCFLNARPIVARPISRTERVARWCRRNPLAASLIGLIGMLLVMAGVIGWMRSADLSERRVAATRRVNELLQEAVLKQGEARGKNEPALWAEALAFVKQAEGLLEASPANAESHRKVTELRDLLHREQADVEQTTRQRERDHRLAQRLEAIRLDAATLIGRRTILAPGLQRVLAVLKEDDLDVLHVPPEEAARQVRDRALCATICDHLLAVAASSPDAAQRQRLFMIVRQADPHPARDQLFADLAADDVPALKAWARSDKLRDMSASVYLTLSATLASHRLDTHAVEVLRAAQNRFASDFWVSYNLGALAVEHEPPRWQEGLACFRAARAVRPDSPAVLNNLGIVLAQTGAVNEGIALLRQAVVARPDLAHMHFNLASALRDRGDLEEAGIEFQRTVALKKDYVEAYALWGQALMMQGRLPEAIAKYRRVLKLVPESQPLHKEAAGNIAHCRRLLPLQSRLEEVVQGKSKPAAGGEWMEFAELCYFQKKYATAARLARDALAAHPELATDRAEAWHRYNAACYAALAASGQGLDTPGLDDTTRSAWRKLALQWLRADFESWHTQWRTGTPQKRAQVGRALAEWMSDHALDGVRDLAAREGMPQPEQAEWARLWDDVEGLLREARR